MTADASDDDIVRGVFRTMRRRDHDVVLVRRTIKPGMLGIWNGEGMGRGWKGGGKGSKRQKGLRHNYAVNLYNVYNDCLNVECN